MLGRSFDIRSNGDITAANIGSVSRALSSDGDRTSDSDLEDMPLANVMTIQRKSFRLETYAVCEAITS